MAGIDELRAKAIASMAAGGNPNSKLKRKSTESREEGEVSDDDEEVPTCSGVTATTGTLTGSAFPNLKSEQRKRLRSGDVRLSGDVLRASCSPSSLAEMQQRASTLENHTKQIKRFPNKSRNPAWRGHSGSNDNLIISFSAGDDTDSDSEESDSERTVKEKVDKGKMDMSNRPLRASNLQPEILQRRPNDQMKVLPTKTTISHPSISFVTKVQSAYPRTLGPSSAPAVEKETSVHRHDAVINVSLNPELGHAPDVNMADDKVRNLRQQIAVRENALRIQKMSVPESKDKMAYFDRRFHGTSLKPDAKAFRTDSSLDKIPCSEESKQLKPDENPCSKVSSDCLSQMQLPLMKSISETKTGALETSDHLEAVTGARQPTNGTALEKNDASINEQRWESNSSLHVSSGIYPLQMKDKEPLITSNQVDGNTCQKDVPSPPETSSLQDVNFTNSSSHLKLQEQSSMDREVLLHVEELHDKELEEAQEIRRKCEVEEMRALKAYRKAREALIAANNRCSLLYRRRELLSLFASRWLSHREVVPKTSDDLLSELNHLMDAEGQDLCQVGFKCSTQFADDLPLITSNLQTSGDDLSSDQGCKNDGNVRNPEHMVADSKQPNVLMDVEQASPIDNGSVQSRTVHQKDEVNAGVKTVDIDVESERIPVQHVHDFELEASLRSKLVARLGVKSASKNSAGTYDAYIQGSEMDTENEQSSAYMWIVPFLPNQQLQKGEKIAEGVEISGRKSSQCPRQMIQSDDREIFFEGTFNRNTSRLQDNSCPKGSCVPKQIAALSMHSVLQIVCKHFKLLFLEPSTSHEEGVDVSFTTTNRGKEDKMSLSSLASVGSQNMDFTIDPFWPLCMFELRGKCNDEECPWQHLKECTRQKTKQIGPSSFSSDNQVSSSEILVKVNDVCRFPQHLRHNVMSIPTYLIGSNLIKSDAQLSQSVLARSMCHYWQISFCTSFPLPFSVQRILPPDTRLLHAGDTHATDDDNWNRPSLYLSSKDNAMRQLKQCLSDPEQTLELALELFNQKANSMDVRRKVLAVLARAIEADPNSVVLWIVYLQIYYRKEKHIGVDDMFSHAVKTNEDSYELWHLFINSRMHLVDRMNAYDKALSVLCRWAYTPDKEDKYISACILDLSLQMIDFLCMCGDIDKAISRVCELCPATDLGTSDHILLSDILPCLLIPDRCILWVCCIYVVIYRKLPEAIVQQFELEKDLPFAIEWATTQLSAEEKYQALDLMEKAVDALALGDDNNLYAKDHSPDNLQRSAHFLAISHIKCVATVDSLDRAVGLLAEYVSMYPTCVELLLISARLQKISTKEVFIEGFEEVLLNWPKEIPGSQCLWNQYAEYALEYGRVDFAEKLMEHWFHSFCENQNRQCKEAEARMDVLCDSCDLPSSLLPGAAFYSSKKDAIFGLLNLCLYNLLQKNMEEARLAVDKALDLATEQEFGHCVRERAAFLFFSGSIPLTDRPYRAILDLLNCHLRDIRSCFTSQPLSRRFYRNVKKPKLRQSISYLLGPISLDFSLLNSVLVVIHGPSLLPEMFKGPKDLVDYVESLMAIMPANYQLAFSVYNFVCSNRSRASFAFKSMMFWVSSLLVNSIFQSFPVAPESVWLEAANVLSHLEIQGISEAFHQQAVSVYPFSLKLWQSYFNLSKTVGNVHAVLEAAKKRGFDLS